MLPPPPRYGLTGRPPRLYRGLSLPLIGEALPLRELARLQAAFSRWLLPLWGALLRVGSTVTWLPALP